MDVLHDSPSAGGESNVSTSRNIDVELLTCGDFDGNCHWHNLHETSVTLKWYQSNAYLDPSYFQLATGSDLLPTDYYAVAASDDPSNNSSKAILMSEVISCPAGSDMFSLMYWLSPWVELSLCIKSAKKAYPNYDFCSILPGANSPGPINIVIPPMGDTTFQIFLIAKNFTYDSDNFRGGFAILDNVTFPEGSCVEKLVTNPDYDEFVLTSLMSDIGEDLPTTTAAGLNNLSVAENGSITELPTFAPVIITLGGGSADEPSANGTGLTTAVLPATTTTTTVLPPFVPSSIPQVSEHSATESSGILLTTSSSNGAQTTTTVLPPFVPSSVTDAPKNVNTTSPESSGTFTPTASASPVQTTMTSVRPTFFRTTIAVTGSNSPTELESNVTSTVSVTQNDPGLTLTTAAATTAQPLMSTSTMGPLLNVTTAGVFVNVTTDSELVFITSVVPDDGEGTSGEFQTTTFLEVTEDGPKNSSDAVTGEVMETAADVGMETTDQDSEVEFRTTTFIEDSSEGFNDTTDGGVATTGQDSEGEFKTTVAADVDDSSDSGNDTTSDGEVNQTTRIIDVLNTTTVAANAFTGIVSNSTTVPGPLIVTTIEVMETTRQGEDDGELEFLTTIAAEESSDSFNGTTATDEVVQTTSQDETNPELEFMTTTAVDLEEPSEDANGTTVEVAVTVNATGEAVTHSTVESIGTTAQTEGSPTQMPGTGNNLTTAAVVSTTRPSGGVSSLAPIFIDPSGPPLEFDDPGVVHGSASTQASPSTTSTTALNPASTGATLGPLLGPITTVSAATGAVIVNTTVSSAPQSSVASNAAPATTLGSILGSVSTLEVGTTRSIASPANDSTASVPDQVQIVTLGPLLGPITPQQQDSGATTRNLTISGEDVANETTTPHGGSTAAVTTAGPVSTPETVPSNSGTTMASGAPAVEHATTLGSLLGTIPPSTASTLNILASSTPGIHELTNSSTSPPIVVTSAPVSENATTATTVGSILGTIFPVLAASTVSNLNPTASTAGIAGLSNSSTSPTEVTSHPAVEHATTLESHIGNDPTSHVDHTAATPSNDSTPFSSPAPSPILLTLAPSVDVSNVSESTTIRYLLGPITSLQASTQNVSTHNSSIPEERQNVCTALSCTFDSDSHCSEYTAKTFWETSNTTVGTWNATAYDKAIGSNNTGGFAFISGPIRWSRLMTEPFHLPIAAVLSFDYRTAVNTAGAASFTAFVKRNDTIFETMLSLPEKFSNNDPATWRTATGLLLGGAYEYVAFEVRNLAENELVGVDSLHLNEFLGGSYCSPR